MFWSVLGVVQDDATVMVHRYLCFTQVSVHHEGARSLFGFRIPT